MTRKRGKRSKGGANKQDKEPDEDEVMSMDDGNTKTKVVEKTVAEVLSDIKANAHLYKNETNDRNSPFHKMDSGPLSPRNNMDANSSAHATHPHNLPPRSQNAAPPFYHRDIQREKYGSDVNDSFRFEHNDHHRNYGSERPRQESNDHIRFDPHDRSRPPHNDLHPHARNERHFNDRNERHFQENGDNPRPSFRNQPPPGRFGNDINMHDSYPHESKPNPFRPREANLPDRPRGPPPEKIPLLPPPNLAPSVPSLFDIDPFSNKPPHPKMQAPPDGPNPKMMAPPDGPNPPLLAPPETGRPPRGGPDHRFQRSMPENEHVIQNQRHLNRVDRPPFPPLNKPPPRVDQYGSQHPRMDERGDLRANFDKDVEKNIAAIMNDPLCTEAEKQAAIDELRSRRAEVPRGRFQNERVPPPRPPAVASLFSREEENELRRSLQLHENMDPNERFNEPPPPHHKPDSFQRRPPMEQPHGERRKQYNDASEASRRDRMSREHKERVGRRTYLSGKINELFSNAGYGSDDCEESDHSVPSKRTGADGIKVDNEAERKRSQELYDQFIGMTEEEMSAFKENNKEEENKEEENKKIPAFLLCPLCHDLLDDPVVLPCFHTLCREKCLSRVIKNEKNVWCPQCSDLVYVKPGIDSLKPAVTFEKMISQHKEEREKQMEEMEKELEGDIDKIAEAQKRIFQKRDKAEDITCTVCNMLYSFPVKLQCGHSICKFPCAYKTVQFNSKILCGRCEKPCWVNSINELAIDKEAIFKVQSIKGEHYLQDHARQIRALEDEDRAYTSVGITALFDDDETFKWRISLLDEVNKQKDEIPSLLHLPLGATLPVKKPKDGKKKSKKKKKDSLEEDDFNPEELFPSEDPPPIELPPMEAPPPEVYYQPEPQSVPPPQNTPADFLANLVRGQVPIYTPVSQPPPTDIAINFSVPPPVSSVGGIPLPADHNLGYSEAVPTSTPAPVQAPFQPPVLDVKSMVPENPGPDFDYIAPWNLFAQQTQNYYSTYYAAVGGIPGEAQTQVKEYLEKCWSWYSAYFKLQTAKSEKPDKSGPIVEPASKIEATEIASQVKKLKSAKHKKEKEKLITEFSSEVAASVTADEKAEALEIEELKILLLKKQLELKLKTAKSKSETRDLKKLKELVEEEEGAEELDEESKKKKEKEAKEAREKDLEQLREAARQKQLERERQIEELEKKRKRTRQEELRKLEKARKKTKEKREREEKEREEKDRRKREGSRDDYEDRPDDDYRKGDDYYKVDNYRGGHDNFRGGFRGRGRGDFHRGGFQPRGRGRGRGRGGQWHGPGAPWERQDSYNSYDPYDSRPQPPYTKKRKISRSLSKSRSRSRSGSPSHDSRRSSRSRSGSADSYRRPPRVSPPPKKKPAMKLPDPAEVDEKTANEPKFIKVTNLPDDVTAKSLKSFVEAFGRVENCKIGKMQGEMMAVCQMQTMADAISCVREMHGLPFKGKILDVKYMGNKPMVKQVEVSIPDVYDRPAKSKPKPTAPASAATGSSTSFTGNTSQRLEQRKLLVSNLPWGTTEHEVIDIVSRHAFVLSCRVATNPDRNNRGLYAEVVLESYFDVLKCINAMHGTRYEGRQLEVKKLTM